MRSTTRCRCPKPLRRRLKEAYGVEAKVVSPEMLGDFSQHFDAERRTFMISALLRPENRTFGLAYQLALLELAPLLERMVGRGQAARCRHPRRCCT